MSLLSRHTSGARLYDTHNVFGTFAAKAGRVGEQWCEAFRLDLAAALLDVCHLVDLVSNYRLCPAIFLQAVRDAQQAIQPEVRPFVRGRCESAALMHLGSKRERSSHARHCHGTLPAPCPVEPTSRPFQSAFAGPPSLGQAPMWPPPMAMSAGPAGQRMPPWAPLRWER